MNPIPVNTSFRDIIYGITIKKIVGSTDITVGENSLTFDSQQVREGSVFFAVQGTKIDGHDFIDKACMAGCVAVIAQREVSVPEHVTLVITDNVRRAMGIIAHNFYRQPSHQLKLIGITGTNGKTTTATLLYELFTKLGHPAGLISTIANYLPEQTVSSLHTTPDPITLNRFLASMVAHRWSYCFMEVSSHAIDQHRIEQLKFAGAVFTNLTHDHLDYHATFKEYAYTKKRLFDNLPPDSFALVNKDDKNGEIMVQNSRAKKYTYALKNTATYKIKILENQFSGMQLRFSNADMWSPLVGEFNAYNLLVAYAVASLTIPVKEQDILLALSSIKPVEGRFDRFVLGEGIQIIVDYAHTPDALENVLKTINAIRTQNEILYTIIGCGGDRDKEKRPKMAQIACQYSNKVIFTSDNPRSEDPKKIIQEMQTGVSPHDFKKTLNIIDRKEAIKTALFMAKKNDIILIAGKGHEKYQEINGVRHEFDDKLIAINTELN